MIKLKTIIESFYTDIGHNANDYVWIWNAWNDEFKKLKMNKGGFIHGHRKYFPGHSADFGGRYDVNKNIITISSMEPGETNSDLSSIPPNLIKRLKFEFGDNAKIKRFY